MSTAGLLEQLIPGEAHERRTWCPTCERYPGMAHTCLRLDAETQLRAAQ